MTLRRALLVLVLTVLAALSGCGDREDDPTPSGQPPGGDLDATYVVTGVTVDGRSHALVAGTEIRVRFAGDQLTLTAGCNTMSGKYVLEGTRLTVESLATTDMGCDQARMDQDTWLAALFAKPVQFTTGENATIVSGSTVLALTDREKASPDKPLVGTKWLLDSIGGTGADAAVGSVPAGVVVTATFQDGQLLAYDGCNGGSAPLTVDGDRLVIGDRTQTLRGCTDARDEVSRQVNAVLSGTVRFAIEEKGLTVTKGDRMLVFRAVDELPAHD